MKTLLVVAALLLIAGAIGYALLEKHPGYGVYYGLAKLAGSRLDIAPVDWARLTRRATPNDALVCPATLCPNAKPDWESKVYSRNPDDLLAALRRIALADPGTVEVPGMRNERRAHFIQYSRLMRFPDTIDIEVLPVDANQSTLAIYSRSLVGRKDFGVNRARITRWLAALDTNRG